MMNVLGLLGHEAAQSIMADHLATAQIQHLPRSGVIALGTIEKPTDKLLQTIARRVPSGAPRLAPRSHRNFLLAASAVAGEALQQAPHAEHVHAALSNISHSIVGHHAAMLDADQYWIKMYEKARGIADDFWNRMPYHSREGWIAHHHQLKYKACVHLPAFISCPAPQPLQHEGSINAPL
jgi:hypothetical protein